MPKLNMGQTAPNLGNASSFAYFTANGAFTVTGTPTVTGDVGNGVGAHTAFPPGILFGDAHWGDATATSVAADVVNAYSDLSQGGSAIAPALGGQWLTSGVYTTGAASILDGTLTLDAGGDPNALFIIRIGGALATTAGSIVLLTNSASLCNVYWQIGGQFDLEDGSVFRGTAIVDGAIHLLGSSSLFGRAFSRVGAISLVDNLIQFIPAAAGTITGTPTVCQGQSSEIYTVPEIEDADSYIWTLPSGATGTSTTNSITVDFGISALSGDITVKGNNSCGGNGLPSTLAITVNLLPLTSAIYHQ